MAPSQPRDPLAGHIGHLTQPEQDLLDEFKKELENDGTYDAVKHDDATLLRFCRARKFNLANTMTMWKNYQDWRKENNVDDLLHFEYDEEERDKVMDIYPQYYHRTDKDGRPIYIEQLGKFNIDELYRVSSQERLTKRFISQYEQFIHERLPAASAVVGRPVETSCTIMDIGGVSLGQFYKVKDAVAQSASIGQNYYPECMGKFYIINAPFLFYTVWSVVKLWLDEVTVAKISILGSNYKDALLQQIPIENLPKEFGGLCDCPGKGGCKASNAGPWNVPPTTPATGELSSSAGEPSLKVEEPSPSQ